MYKMYKIVNGSTFLTHSEKELICVYLGQQGESQAAGMAGSIRERGRSATIWVKDLMRDFCRQSVGFLIPLKCVRQYYGRLFIVYWYTLE